MSGRIVVDPGDLIAAATLMGTARGDLQLLARKIATDPKPEMPANIAAQVRTRTGHVSAALRNRSNELEAEAGDLSLRALWAAATSGYAAGLGKRVTLSELRTLRKLISNVPLLISLGILPSRLKGYIEFLPSIRNWNYWIGAGVPVEEEGGQLTLTAIAQAELNENHPGVFNNSWLGRSLAKALPDDSYLAKLLGNASRATPFFRRVGIAGGLVSTGYGAYSTANDIGLHKGGEKIAVDVTGTAFSASTTAALMLCAAGATSEIPPLAIGIVVATGIMYAGAVGYQHRKILKHAAVWYWEHGTLEGIAFHHRREIGHVLDKGTDLAGSGYHKAKDLAESAYDWAIG
ncbi:MAG: hypothetical protein WBQ14_11515 [Gaiellaceae bacterium]